MDYESIPGKEYEPGKEIRCCLCGHWITFYEYGGWFRGNYVDFSNKIPGEITMTFCNECMAKIMEYCEDC
jgi:hypothetical protein